MDRPCCRKRTLALLAALFGAVTLVANPSRNPPDGAAALGRAGGRLATVDDATAIAHNPANLTELEAPEAVLSLTLGWSHTDYRSPLGMEADTESAMATLPGLFVAWPLKDDRTTVGLGVSVPYGQSTEWSRTGLFRYAAPFYGQLAVAEVNPTVALAVNDWLSLGLGVDVYYSTFDFEQVFPWQAVTGNPADLDGIADFDSDGWGLGGNAAATVKLPGKQRLALTYRSGFEIDYTGDFSLSRRPPTAGLPPPLRGLSGQSRFSSEINFPPIVGIGYGINIGPRLQLGLDAEWVNFSHFKHLDIDIGQHSVLLPATTLPEDWHNTWNYGIGVEWQWRPEVTLRAGYQFLESPIPDHTLSPVLPDADRHVITLGVGFRFCERHRLDLAWAYSFFDDREVDDDANPAYNGDYDIESYLFSVSYTCVFP